jgi:hypothetical protein
MFAPYALVALLALVLSARAGAQVHVDIGFTFLRLRRW